MLDMSNICPTCLANPRMPADTRRYAPIRADTPQMMTGSGACCRPQRYSAALHATAGDTSAE